MIKLIKGVCFGIVTMLMSVGKAQDVNALIQKVRMKMEQVNTYEASGTMKTNVTFLKVPESAVKIYFKKPDKLKIRNEKGISFVPKGVVSINLNNILNGSNYTALDAGTDKIGTVTVRVIKLLPQDDNADVVLSTLYIDETNLVIKRAKTTTRENGSYQLEMTYGKYIAYSLPDKIIFTFNAREYKLPKGVTFDFDDGTAVKKPATANTKKNTGMAEITFDSYKINKEIPADIFR